MGDLVLWILVGWVVVLFNHAIIFQTCFEEKEVKLLWWGKIKCEVIKK